MIQRKFLVALVMLTLSSCSGCLFPVPIAAFMAPCCGNGEIIEFRDHQNKRIRCDGWAIIKQSTTWGWQRVLSRTHSDQLVRVCDGILRIPERYAPATLWLVPSPFAGVGFTTWPPPPPLTTLFGVACFFIPVVEAAPQEEISLMPLVPGQFPAFGEIRSSPDPKWWNQSNERLDRKVITVSKCNSAQALQYWKVLASYEFVLEPREFELARAIINAELRHLAFQKPPVTSQPADKDSSRRTLDVE